MPLPIHSAAATWLMFASAALLFLLGALHLLYTFHGPKLRPRDPALQARMKEVSPVISGQTDMWKCWIGFNASHSLSALLFGLVYGYLALAQEALLFSSPFLLTLGLATLLAYAVLGKRYWFRIPFAGICIALFCCLASLAVGLS